LARSFGRRVRELREARGWSQSRMGAEVGLQRTYINSVENGGRNVTLATIGRIADAFGLSIESLFAGVSADTAEDGNTGPPEPQEQ